MMTRTLAASAAVLVMMTGGALAQAANSADETCAALNGMASADQLAFAQEYIDTHKGNGAAGAMAARPNDAQLGAGANQAGEPGEASGGPEAAAGAAAQSPAQNGQQPVQNSMAAAPDNGQPALAGKDDNRNQEMEQANAADNGGQPLPADGAADDEETIAGASDDSMPAPVAGADADDVMESADSRSSSSNTQTESSAMANNETPAGVNADDAVRSFDGMDAAGLVAECAANPDKTFVDVMPMPQTPAAQ